MIKKIKILILSFALLIISCDLPDNSTQYVDKLVVFGKIDMLQISENDYNSSIEVTVSMSSAIDNNIEDTDELYINDATVKITGNFNLDDFAKQLKQMGKMGGVSGILSMLPGVSKAQKLMAENKISDKLINHQIAIINSMTKQERTDPNLIKASRKIRISKGSGTRVQDVNKLLKQFLQSQKMMKRMKSMGKVGMPNDLMQKLQGNFPPKLN